MRDNRQKRGGSRGFTLIEIMVAMVIALILLAGLVTTMISQQKTATMVTDRTDRLSDLFLATQIMQTALRDAQALCWDNTNRRIVYQPLDSTVGVTSPCTATVDAQNSFFRFDAATAVQTATVCWDRPNLGGGCQELLRELKDGTGLQVFPATNTDLKALRKIILTALVINRDRNNREIFMEFNVWPRN